MSQAKVKALWDEHAAASKKYREARPAIDRADKATALCRQARDEARTALDDAQRVYEMTWREAYMAAVREFQDD